MQTGYYFPNFSQFDFNFCLDVFTGYKKVLINNQISY